MSVNQSTGRQGDQRAKVGADQEMPRSIGCRAQRCPYAHRVGIRRGEEFGGDPMGLSDTEPELGDELEGQGELRERPNGDPALPTLSAGGRDGAGSRSEE